MSRPKLAPAAALLLVTLAAYLPALRAGFVWDDDDYLAHNAALVAPGGLLRFWYDPDAAPQYYPLVESSFWLEHRLWGFRPAGYHLVNVVLHGLNAVLLWRLLRRLAVPGAWLAAVLFALHPVHVESVAWAQERKNVLSGFFYLAAFLAYLRFARPTPAAPDAPPARLGRRGWYVLALFLGLCALLSKTATCTLPAALLLVLWWQRGRLDLRTVGALLPLFGLSVVMGLVTMWVEKHHVGAAGSDWRLSPPDRLLVAGRALWFYAGKLAWPAPLIFMYPRWQVDESAAWQYLFPVTALAVLAVLALGRRRLGGGPLTACLFFAGTLAPTLGFFNVFYFRYSFVADHFQYLASMGLIALAAAVAATWLPLERLGARLVLGVVLVVLAGLTWRQCGIYRDHRTLWEDVLAKNPDCWAAHYNLGRLALDQGDARAAERGFARSAELKPEHVDSQINWGVALVELGEYAPAESHFAAALRLRPGHPDAELNWGISLARQRKFNEAAQHFRAVLAAEPNSARAHYYLGVSLAQQEQLEEAAAQLAAAVEVAPEFAEAYHEQGEALSRLGRPAEAVASYSRAVVLRPANAEYRRSLGQALQRQGQVEAAEAQFREAWRLGLR